MSTTFVHVKPDWEKGLNRVIAIDSCRICTIKADKICKDCQFNFALKVIEAEKPNIENVISIILSETLDDFDKMRYGMNETAFLDW